MVFIGGETLDCLLLPPLLYNGIKKNKRKVLKNVENNSEFNFLERILMKRIVIQAGDHRRRKQKLANKKDLTPEKTKEYEDILRTSPSPSPQYTRKEIQNTPENFNKLFPIVHEMAKKNFNETAYDTLNEDAFYAVQQYEDDHKVTLEVSLEFALRKKIEEKIAKDFNTKEMLAREDIFGGEPISDEEWEILDPYDQRFEAP